MHLGQPLWIIIGALSCTMLFLLFLHREKRRVQALEKFASKNLLGSLTRNVSTSKRKIKIFLYLVAVFTCFVALARPQFGYHWIDAKRRGIDILFALDTSASMLAEDIRPNRLERSKFAVLDFISRLDGDRIGLMPFAGSAFLMCPLTIDYTAFEQSLLAVDTTIVPTPGTNIAEAIRQAESVLANDTNYKILIVITDGENLEGDVIQAAADAGQRGMIIFTVGVGTASGELIPRSVDGKQEFIKDADGRFVISRLDEETLQEIAAGTNGLYVPLGSRGEGLETIYRQKLAMVPKEELTERRHKVAIDRFQWALGAGLFFFICEFLLSSRKTGSFSLKMNGRIGGKTTALMIIFAVSLLLHPAVLVASPGEDAYREEDYLSSSQYYLDAIEKDPENAVLHFNYGASAYKNNLYDDAITSFSRALADNDLQLQEKAYYNRGNAFYKKGEEGLQVDPQQTIQLWQEAIGSYDSSLQLQPENDDARVNREIVMKKLEELRRQEEERKKQQKEESDQRRQDDDNSDPDGGERQEEGDDSQQSPPPEQTAGEEEEKQETGNDKEPEQQQPSPAQNEIEKTETGEDKAESTPGKMSREEAEQLLNELKNEEGTLNFMPQAADSNTAGRDW